MLFFLLLCVWILAGPTIAYSQASYHLLKDYQAGTTKFFDNFDFFTGSDPTNGFVKFDIQRLNSP
jgi:hypothetical protein